jgi:7,8-dihydropterin-6-yl-methyl-4-(beta-D-ribofuranosyl)aminobenzene 5'-phosphate synthase
MASDLQITVLVNDEPGEGLTAEHGLSLWIETSGKRILFDTGQGGALVPNAQKLGVPLDETDLIVLSHGHYDHTDGLPEIFSLAPKASLIVHPEALSATHSIGPSGLARAVGMSAAARAAIEQMPAKSVVWSSRPVSVTTNVSVTGTIARETDFEDVGGPFFIDDHGQNPDPMTDDQALWIDTAQGVVVCVGCSHAGLINTLSAVRRAGGTSQIRAVIGGFHLLNASEQRLERTCDALLAMGPQMMAPFHCTGSNAVHRLKEVFGERVSACRSGMRFQFVSEH